MEKLFPHGFCWCELPLYNITASVDTATAWPPKHRVENTMGHMILEQEAVQNEGPLKIPVSEKRGLNLIHHRQGRCNSQLYLGQLKQADTTQHKKLLPAFKWFGNLRRHRESDGGDGWAGSAVGCRWWRKLTWLQGVACVPPMEMYFWWNKTISWERLTIVKSLKNIPCYNFYKG